MPAPTPPNGPGDHDDLTTLRRRVAELERRLADVEQVLAATPPAPAPVGRAAAEHLSLDRSNGGAERRPEAQPDPSPPRQPESDERGWRLNTPPPLPAPDRAPPAHSGITRAQPLRREPPPIPAAVASKKITLDAAPAAARRSIETLIGQNWASWVGAIVLFLGVVFFLKYAWDQGWIRPSPEVRVAAAVAFGVALGGVGEWVHRRRMRALAGTLYGAGVAVVVASFFGAYAYFEPPVLGANAAFAAVALTAAVAVAAALHINVSAVALVGLLGAYLAPNLLAGPQDRSNFFMIYLATLALVGLGLAHFKPRWISLRWLVLAGTYVWLALWWNSTGRAGAREGLAILTAIGFAALFVVEAAATLVRHSRDVDAGDRVPAPGVFGLHIGRGPVHVHVILTSIIAIAASMVFMRGSWGAAGATRIATAAIATAILLALPGLGLNHLRPKWVWVRWCVLVLSYAWLAVWWNDVGSRGDQRTLAVLWAIGLYAACLVENVMTLRRHGGMTLYEPAPPARGASVGPPLAPPPLPPPALDAHVAVASLLATAGSFGAMLWAWRGHDLAILGAVACALAVLQAAAGLVARSRDYFVSSLLQAAALVTLAVPLVLDQYAVTLAWMTLATAVALAGWQLNLPAARRWAALLLSLALARLIVLDWRDPQLAAVHLVVFGQPVTLWLLTGWAVALLFHLLAWLRPGAGRWPGFEAWVARTVPAATSGAPGLFGPSPVLAYASRAGAAAAPVGAKSDGGGVFYAVVGTIAFAVITMSRWNGAPLTLALVAWLGGLVALSKAGARVGYGAQALVLGALVSVRWLTLDNLEPLARAWNSGAADAAPFFNVPALCGILLALAAALGARLCPRSSSDSDPETTPATAGPSAAEAIRPVLVVWSSLIVFALLNFETIRFVDALPGLADRAIVKQVSMSVLWAAVGFGSVMFGFRRHVAPLRWAALALLGVTLVKILAVDMAEVKAIWRILSFVAVGVLLLCVSFVYHRQVDSSAATADG